MIRKCGNCRFYAPEKEGSPQGHCCVNPPQLYMGQSPAQLAGRVNIQMMGLMPPTAAERIACKEWQSLDPVMIATREMEVASQ